MDRVVQDDQFRTGLHSIDRAVKVGSSSLKLNCSSHMVHVLTNLEKDPRQSSDTATTEYLWTSLENALVKILFEVKKVYRVTMD